MSLNADEASFLQSIDAAFGETRAELIDLVTTLVAFDTTGRMEGEPPRDEVAMQAMIAGRLTELGATVDVWEPSPPVGARSFLPKDIDFEGRPQLAARLPGAGGGRSLLLAGHIDCVSAEPKDLWASDPLRVDVRDGRLFGRGTADMKGGIAAVLLTLKILKELQVKLMGDVVVSLVTDEETSGAGSWAAAEHGVAADAGLCPEGTGFNAWVACRGGMCATVTIPGRAGHADKPQPHWREGGAVNAVEKLDLVLQGVRLLRNDWRTRPDQRHSLLSPPDIVPTLVRGGDWAVTYPAHCSLTCEITYLPPPNGTSENAGAAVRQEVEARLNAAASADPWLAEHPLDWSWSSECLPASVASDLPLVSTALAAAAELARSGRAVGMDSWHDAANYTIFAETPTISFGPGTVATGHTVDEWVAVEELVDYMRILARTIMRWCGVAEEQA